MSNSNSFGGKLRKVLASMCSLFVGASGVSQANPPGTALAGASLGPRTGVFGFGDIGWKFVSDNAKKEDSWLNGDGNRYQRLYENHLSIDVGFVPVENSNCVSFCVWYGNTKVIVINVPKGVLFDAMRHFELKYFPNVGDARDKGTELSCNGEELDEDNEDEVFLRFILWAFCGSNDAINPNYNATFEELKNSVFRFVINLDDPDGTGNEFEVMGEENQFAVLESGYLLENFNLRVREVYSDLGYDVTNINKMASVIGQLNAEKRDLEVRLNALNNEKGNLVLQINNLNGEKRNLELQLGNLNSAKGNLEAQLNALNGEKRNLELQLNNLNNEKVGLNRDIGNLNSEKAILNQRIVQLSDEKRNLELQLGNLNSAKGNLEAQLNALNGEKVGLQQQLNKLDLEHKNLEQQFNALSAEKEKLKNQKRISSALGALIGLIAGGALVEGAHRFLGAKRSRSSEVNNGKTSSNEKGEQRAKRNLKRQKS